MPRNDRPGVVFKDFQVCLNADRLFGAPHIIDTKQSQTSQPGVEYTIADAIVTMLCKYNAEALHAFMDGNKPYFVMQRRLRDPSFSFPEEYYSRDLTCFDLF
jgi:hypothetical protein